MEKGEEYSEIFVKLTAELKEESDRAIALLSAAYLDELLKDLLGTLIVAGAAGKKKEIFEGSSAPLSTFSSRILLSFALGLISLEDKIDLNLIRKIRNAFAHQLMGLTFDTVDISGLCAGLMGGRVGGVPSTNREIFVKASVRQMVEIIIKLNRLESENF